MAAASLTVVLPCWESVALLVSKNTMQDLVGPGGAGGGECRANGCGDSPHAARAKAIAAIADSFLIMMVPVYRRRSTGENAPWNEVVVQRAWPSRERHGPSGGGTNARSSLG